MLSAGATAAQCRSQTFTSCANNATGRSQCANTTAYIGSNPVKTTRLSSAHECRAKCAMSTSCGRFTFFAGNRSCSFFGTGENLQRARVSGATSGFAQCGCADRKNSIAAWSYAYCKALVNLTIPRVKSIGAYAFYGCASLESMSIPCVCPQQPVPHSAGPLRRGLQCGPRCCVARCAAGRREAWPRCACVCQVRRGVDWRKCFSWL